ncbi:pirin family protein [Nocardioides iriomotensis]|uniref:Pirin family protein n=1 Tax=Nocardioides iriomotensis TaxID=715784 RepID=A0A4Q5IX51_9ACTN|nr:pirin family protein [Nocardioides iriomotensis]RYU09469.1 pirin family protein [Nocardioides iriomotensis]
MAALDAVHEPLLPRDVLLGRTTHVRRVLPNKTRRMVGAWCFLDHYGPDDVKTTGGMWVPPHPHTGLQTVTWLFEGLGRHTDSLGSHQLIRPGQLNVMTAGHGICHAEVSPDDAPRLLHGVQLWVCLPDAVRDSTPPDFTHLADLPTYTEGGVTLKVLVGELAGEVSPAPAFTPLVGAEIRLRPGASATLPLEPEFEHAVLTVAGDLRVEGRSVPAHEMAYLGTGRHGLLLEAPDSGDDVVLMLLGGAPFEEEIVMWWNLIGRSHDEVVEQREAWNGPGVSWTPPRYGEVAGFDGDRLLAPPMPNVRLRTRGRTA